MVTPLKCSTKAKGKKKENNEDDDDDDNSRSQIIRNMNSINKTLIFDLENELR